MPILLDKAKHLIISNALQGWIAAATLYNKDVKIGETIKHFIKYFNLDDCDMHVERLYQIYIRQLRAHKNEKGASMAIPDADITDLNNIT